MHILLVEDDTKTALYVTEALRKQGHPVHWAATGADGLAQARGAQPGLIIVDRMLPALDGLSLLRQLRKDGIDAPALMLTAMGDVDDRVEGLNGGADDYLAKPFAVAELLARVQALLRRAHSGAPTRLRVDGLELDLVSRTVRRNGNPIELQNQEFRLLQYLMQNADRLVTRAMLLEHVWNLNFDPRSNLVESHISRLRAKIDRGYSHELIQTMRGAGYVLRA